MQTMKKNSGGFRSPANLIEGLVEIFVYSKGTLIGKQTVKNILLYQGLAEVIRTLFFSSPTAPRIVTRMCVGDQGTLPSDSTVPKVPVKNMTGLFHEVYRMDFDSTVPTLYSPTGFTYTGNTTINQNTLTNLSSTVGVTNGMVVTGTGIPQGSVVVQVINPTTVQISNLATSTNTGINITFSGTINQCQCNATFDASVIPTSAFANPSNPIINEVGLVIINPVASGGISRPPVAAPNAPDSDEIVLSVRTFSSVPFQAANDITINVRYTIYTE